MAERVVSKKHKKSYSEKKNKNPWMTKHSQELKKKKVFGAMQIFG